MHFFSWIICISRLQHSIYFVRFLVHMSIPLVYFSLWLFNVLALFRVQWRSRIQDICFHFHPNSITSFTHSSTKPIDNYYINDGTVAAVMKESHPWINWLLLRIFLCVFTQSPFITNKEIQLKYARWKYICNNSNFDVVYLFRCTHSSTLSFSQPSSVFTQASPGDRQSLEMKGILGKRSGSWHPTLTVQWTNCNIFQHDFLSCPFTSSLDFNRN